MPKAEGNTQMTLQHETSCPFQFHPKGICYKGGEAYFKPFLPSFLKPPHPGPQLCPLQAAKIRCYLEQSGLKTSKELALLSQGKAVIVLAPTLSLLSLLLNNNFIPNFKCLQQRSR